MRLYTTTLLFWINSLALCQVGENVVGDWRVDWTQTKSAMSSSELTRFEGLPEAVRTQVEQNFSSRVYTLLDSGALQVDWQSSGGAKHEEGVWSLNGEHLIFTVGQKQSTYSWQMPSANRLEITLQNVSASALLSKFILTREQ